MTALPPEHGWWPRQFFAVPRQMALQKSNHTLFRQVQILLLPARIYFLPPENFPVFHRDDGTVSVRCEALTSQMQTALLKFPFLHNHPWTHEAIFEESDNEPHLLHLPPRSLPDASHRLSYPSASAESHRGNRRKFLPGNRQKARKKSFHFPALSLFLPVPSPVQVPKAAAHLNLLPVFSLFAVQKEPRRQVPEQQKLPRRQAPVRS